MPMYTRKAKKYSKKKAYVKKSGHSSQYPFPKRNNIVLRNHIGVGESVNTNLRTSFFANLTSAASGIFTGYLKPGSAYDPTGDLSTIQPVGYDLFSNVFNRYKVNHCWITLTISGVNSAVADSYDWVAAAYPAVDSTAVTTYQGAASQAYAKTFHGKFSTSVTGVALGSGGGQACTRKFYVDNEAVVGAQATAFDIGALVTADPTTLQFALLPIFIQAAKAVASNFFVKVDMFQNVTFSQRKNPVDA